MPGRLRGHVADDRDLCDVFEFPAGGRGLRLRSTPTGRCATSTSAQTWSPSRPVSDVRPDRPALLELEALLGAIEALRDEGDAARSDRESATARSCTGCGSPAATRRSPTLPRTRTSGSPLDALLTCRNECVAPADIYTSSSIFTRDQDASNSGLAKFALKLQISAKCNSQSEAFIATPDTFELAIGWQRRAEPSYISIIRSRFNQRPTLRLEF